MRLETLSECFVTRIKVFSDSLKIDVSLKIKTKKTLGPCEPIVGLLVDVSFTEGNFAEELNQRRHCLDLLGLGLEVGKLFNPEHEPGSLGIHLFAKVPNGEIGIEQTTCEPWGEEWSIEGNVYFVPNLILLGTVPMS